MDIDKFDPHSYAITIRKRMVDGEEVFHASVAELPDVIGLGETYDVAYDMVIDAVLTLFEASQEERRPFPVPRLSDEDFSGRVTLRMEKSLHRQAALLATDEGVSLNSLIVTALNTRVVAMSAMIGQDPRTSTLPDLTFKFPKNMLIVDTRQEPFRVVIDRSVPSSQTPRESIISSFAQPEDPMSYRSRAATREQ